jgi:precorrin-6B methylase 2
MTIGFLILSFVLISLVATFIIVPGFLGAPWSPTEIKKVRQMLLMAKVKPGDVVYDLGSGDGRIIITAAKEFRARSVGIEVNPLFVLWTRRRIRTMGLQDRANVVLGNFFSKDLSKADVVTLFLMQGTNDGLRKKLEEELRPGARVVSHVFTFQDWRHLDANHGSEIYLYEIGNHRDKQKA